MKGTNPTFDNDDCRILSDVSRYCVKGFISAVSINLASNLQSPLPTPMMEEQQNVEHHEHIGIRGCMSLLIVAFAFTLHSPCCCQVLETPHSQALGQYGFA